MLNLGVVYSNVAKKSIKVTLLRPILIEIFIRVDLVSHSVWVKKWSHLPCVRLLTVFPRPGVRLVSGLQERAVRAFRPYRTPLVKTIAWPNLLPLKY